MTFEHLPGELIRILEPLDHGIAKVFVGGRGLRANRCAIQTGESLVERG
jgi:hypothetical protein